MFLPPIVEVYNQSHNQRNNNTDFDLQHEIDENQQNNNQNEQNNNQNQQNNNQNQQNNNTNLQNEIDPNHPNYNTGCEFPQ
jgi:hypothetical protein